MNTTKPSNATVDLPTQSFGQSNGERAAAGKALRSKCSRSMIAEWQPVPNRPDPVSLLIANSAGRDPKLLPLRYGRMIASPFAFYRGAAAIMASDLSSTPDSGLMVVANGDAHLMNYGGFATPERQLVFDINDFDEVSIAPWEWDVRRLATSAYIAAGANGFGADIARDAAREAARSYRINMARYADMSVLDAHYEFIDLRSVLDAIKDTALRKLGNRTLDRAADDDATNQEFTKLAYEAGGEPRIRDKPPLIFHDRDFQTDKAYRAEVDAMQARYHASLAPERRLLVDRFKLVDIATKVVGVGSVGTRCGITLSMSSHGDPLFLQFKEARSSVLEAYCGRLKFKHPGERVVFGQRLMQAASDIFLGTTTDKEGRSLYVRQLRDAKVSPNLALMHGDNMVNYAGLCGWALARAHKRSGDAVTISGYLGTSDVFDSGNTAFAATYAKRNARDHAALVEAVRAGRIEARSDID